MMRHAGSTAVKQQKANTRFTPFMLVFSETNNKRARAREREVLIIYSRHKIVAGLTNDKQLNETVYFSRLQKNCAIHGRRVIIVDMCWANTESRFFWSISSLIKSCDNAVCWLVRKFTLEWEKNVNKPENKIFSLWTFSYTKWVFLMWRWAEDSRMTEFPLWMNLIKMWFFLCLTFLASERKNTFVLKFKKKFSHPTTFQNSGNR